MVRAKDLVVVCLMVTVAVTAADVEFWRFAEGQKSTLRLLTGAYKDGLSAPDLVRGDARAVSDALDRGQGDRHAGVEPRYTILELPNGILNYILEFVSKLTTYEYIALEIVFCLVDFGTIALLIVLGRHMKRRRLLKYLYPLHTKERDDIAPLLLDPRHRTMGRMSLLAQWSAPFAGLALALAVMFAVGQPFRLFPVRPPEVSAEPQKWQYELPELCREQAMLNNEDHYRGYHREMPNHYKAMLERTMLNNENRDRATLEMLDMAISIKHKCFFFNQIAPGY